MLKLPERFVVDRATWLRGDPESAVLLDNHGRRCCVGFLAKEMGLSDSELRNEPALGDVVAQSGLPNELRNDTYNSGAIYTANDAGNSDEAREAKLTALFAAIGIEVRFEGEGNPTPPEAP